MSPSERGFGSLGGWVGRMGRVFSSSVLGLVLGCDVSLVVGVVGVSVSLSDGQEYLVVP